MGTNALYLLKQIEGIRLKHLAGKHDQKSHAPNAVSGEDSKYDIGARVVDNYDGIEPRFVVKLGNKVVTGPKSYYILPDGKLMDLSKSGHIEALSDAKAGKLLGLSDADIKTSREDAKSGAVDDAVWEKVLRNNVRVYEEKDSTNIETSSVDNATFRKLQRYYDTGKLGLSPFSEVVWENEGRVAIRSTVGEFLDARSIAELERNSSFKQVSTYTAPIMSYNESRERGQIADVYTAPYDGQTIGTWLDKRGVERTDQGMYVFYIAIREDNHGVERGQELESKPEDVKLGKGERICRLELRPTQIDGNDKAILREDLRW